MPKYYFVKQAELGFLTRLLSKYNCLIIQLFIYFAKNQSSCCPKSEKREYEPGPGTYFFSLKLYLSSRTLQLFLPIAARGCFVLTSSSLKFTLGSYAPGPGSNLAYFVGANLS